VEILGGWRARSIRQAITSAPRAPAGAGSAMTLDESTVARIQDGLVELDLTVDIECTEKKFFMVKNMVVIIHFHNNNLLLFYFY
jgi:hypothetical protein